MSPTVDGSLCSVADLSHPPHFSFSLFLFFSLSHSSLFSPVFLDIHFSLSHRLCLSLSITPSVFFFSHTFAISFLLSFVLSPILTLTGCLSVYLLFLSHSRVHFYHPFLSHYSSLCLSLCITLSLQFSFSSLSHTHSHVH